MRIYMESISPGVLKCADDITRIGMHYIEVISKNSVDYRIFYSKQIRNRIIVHLAGVNNLLVNKVIFSVVLWFQCE